MSEKGSVVAGAVGSTALRSHFGASLEDHGPNVVLYRAGPQTARRAASLRGRDHSRQSSATPKPLRRPLPIAQALFEQLRKVLLCEVPRTPKVTVNLLAAGKFH